jgi:hypothetical protein
MESGLVRKTGVYRVPVVESNDAVMALARFRDRFFTGTSMRLLF